ncbi:ankyrinprotein [Angomonas deanei]|uniref:Ankyrin repeats (Many copies), putative n=1 Tax=Angomonas deanei TaxID=59799 RepID=A0A7G2CKW7_9TRYP|nr:ankyrinprotein [Angomonas deanei]CAD2220508.1 Ankyrin repeats (many copies), putative [Angomonas deanei]|eukprot:EPY43232.1 ankyrinprotein [Angomonas deanei]
MQQEATTKAQSAHRVMHDSGVPLASTLLVESLEPTNGVHVTSEAPDIFHAACDGDVEALHHHKEAGADLNATGQPNPYSYKGVQFEKRWNFSAPPLVFAASYGRVEAVKALLAWGADVLATSSTGLRARDYAAQRGYHDILAVLDDAEQKATGQA